MNTGLVLAILLAFAFALTNGFHDASNAIATLVATRAATPLQAIILASVFNMLGPLLLGAAVANTIAKIVIVPDAEMVEVVGSGLAAATAWNLITWWRGLPSSSGHALVGGLVGAALVAGGLSAVNWGGWEDGHPVGVFGTLIALLVSPIIGAVVAFVLIKILAVVFRRATARWRAPVNSGQWIASAALAFSHGSNDAQKAVGVIAALLLATGETSTLSSPTWAIVGCAGFLTLGTALGGWKIAKTIGRRIYKIKPLDGFASQAGSTSVILGASFMGAPVSTTHVVASSIVGIGTGRSRFRHVRWAIVKEMLIAWVTTIPAAAALAAVTLVIWRSIA